MNINAIDPIRTVEVINVIIFTFSLSVNYCNYDKNYNNSLEETNL